VKRAIGASILAVIASAVVAEVTMPKPPTPPLRPTIQSTPIMQERDTELTTTIRALDSLRTASTSVERELARIEAIMDSIQKHLPPASRRTKTYGQKEVDQPAIPIRRSIPSAENSGLEVTFTINPDGQATDVKVLSAPLDQVDPLTRAVEGWLYAPAVKAGRRVPVRITTSLRISDD